MTAAELKVAAENIYATTKKVEADNILFKKGLIFHESTIYDYAWMTRDQFLAAYGGDLPASNSSRKRRSLPQAFVQSSECSSTIVPTYKNWVDEDKVSPIQNQNPCGDCYVFSAVAVVESRLSIASGFSPVKLSEMQVTECKTKNFFC